jgi:hypothetical protein
MSVSDLYKQEFDHDVRSRGRDYFLRGRVTIRSAEEDVIEADVQGSELYEVVIDCSDGWMEAECTCAYGDGYCKHIWATILQAEKQEVLPKPDTEFDDLENQIIPHEMIQMITGGRTPSPLAVRRPLRLRDKSSRGSAISSASGR